MYRSNINYFKYGLILLLVIVIYIFLHEFEINKKSSFKSKTCENTYMPCDAPKETKQLSKLLNDAMKEIGQLTCKQSKIDVSDRGGWCYNISSKDSSQHLTDYSLANELSKFFKDKTVASFGDGPGLYKNYIEKLNQVKVYDAFDGAPYAEETTNNDVSHLDLSIPIYHLNLYDWILSMEVAEHIPKKYEQIFIDNLTRHAKEGIILSWSKIGQGGHSHVNNKNFDDVKIELEKRGFIVDMIATRRLKDSAKFGWLKNNLYVYVRTN